MCSCAAGSVSQRGLERGAAGAPDRRVLILPQGLPAANHYMLGIGVARSAGSDGNFLQFDRDILENQIQPIQSLARERRHTDHGLAFADLPWLLDMVASDAPKL